MAVFNVSDPHLVNFGWGQCVGGENGRLIGPFNNVNLLTTQFTNDGLHPRTFHTNASTDRIDVALVGHHGNLRSFARLTHSRFDYYRTVVDLRNFHFKESQEKLWRSAGNLNLWSLRLLGNIIDDYANALTLIPLLTTRLLRPRQNRFKIAKIHNNVAALESLYVAVNQVANLVDVLLIDITANSVTNFLKQDLFGSLGSDATQLFHREREQQGISQLDFITGELASFINREFSGRVFHRVDNHLRRRQFDSSLGIPVDLNVLAGLELFFCRRANGFFHCFDYQIALNTLLLAKCFNVLCNR